MIWTDGSRLESGAVGAALAFRDGERWVRRGTYLGKNKEVFDAEAWVILQAVGLVTRRQGGPALHHRFGFSGGDFTSPARSVWSGLGLSESNYSNGR